MGLEIDRLEQNKDYVVYNNTTGQIDTFYGWKSFVSVVKQIIPQNKQVKDYFRYDELVDAIAELDDDITELDKYFGVWEK